jgi:hypothetical protein
MLSEEDMERYVGTAQQFSAGTQASEMELVQFIFAELPKQ